MDFHRCECGYLPPNRLLDESIQHAKDNMFLEKPCYVYWKNKVPDRFKKPTILTDFEADDEEVEGDEQVDEEGDDDASSQASSHNADPAPTLAHIEAPDSAVPMDIAPSSPDVCPADNVSSAVAMDIAAPPVAIDIAAPPVAIDITAPLSPHTAGSFEQEPVYLVAVPPSPSSIATTAAPPTTAPPSPASIATDGPSATVPARRGRMIKNPTNDTGASPRPPTKKKLSKAEKQWRPVKRRRSSCKAPKPKHPRAVPRKSGATKEIVNQPQTIPVAKSPVPKSTWYESKHVCCATLPDDVESLGKVHAMAVRFQIDSEPLEWCAVATSLNLAYSAAVQITQQLLAGHISRFPMCLILAAQLVLSSAPRCEPHLLVSDTPSPAPPPVTRHVVIRCSGLDRVHDCTIEM